MPTDRSFELRDERQQTGVPPAPHSEAEVPRPAASRLKIAILHQCNAQPDEYVLSQIERTMTERGCRVFTDRERTLSLDWAKNRQDQIQNADFVIPLISSSSVDNEMFTFEVELAHNAARQKAHQLRVIPIRVSFDDPIPKGLGGILGLIEPIDWKGPDDNQRVLDEITKATERSASPKTSASEVSVASLSKDAPPKFSRKLEDRIATADARIRRVSHSEIEKADRYTPRPADAQFQSAIARGESIVLIKGARQMGKTSLLTRALRRAKEDGAHVVHTDLQSLHTHQFESADNLYLSLCELLVDNLNLNAAPQDSWDSRRGPNANFERFLRREVLANIHSRLVWGIDAIDRLFALPFSGEVFALFRSWHNERALDPAGPWSFLSLAIAYATEAHLFIRDLSQSPFNVGTRLRLDDFSQEQVAELNVRFGSPLERPVDLARFLSLTNGHPYLTAEGLRRISEDNTSIDAWAASADLDEGLYGDHLRRLLVVLAKAPEFSEAIRDVLLEKPWSDSNVFYRLRSAGILVGRSEREARVRCPIYANFLSRHFL